MNKLSEIYFSPLSIIKSDEIVKTALNIFVGKKLITDGYFYANGCMDGWKIEHTNENLGIKYIYSDEKTPENLKNKNTLKQLGEIFSNNRDKLISKTSNNFAKSIIHLLLNVEMDGTSNIRKEFYADAIMYLLDLDADKYDIEAGFIKRTNVKLVKIKKVSDLIAELQTPADSQLFYRGHANANYTAEPSVFRDDYYEREYSMYQELVVRCQNDFIGCSSHFDFLKLMQHYGLPTRLLDLTLNPLVALYFACENIDRFGEIIAYSVQRKELKYERSDTLSIISCLPMFSFEDQKLIYENKSNFDGDSNLLDNENIVKRYMDEIRIEKPAFTQRIKGEDLYRMIFVMAGRNNHRIYNQKGAFAAFGLPENKFEKKDDFSNPINEYRLKDENDFQVVFYIPQTNKKDLLVELRRIGIDKSFIYPEIDDVAADIRVGY